LTYLPELMQLMLMMFVLVSLSSAVLCLNRAPALGILLFLVSSRHQTQ
jgi:hypothetical protein